MTIDAFSEQGLRRLLQEEEMRNCSLIYIPLKVSNGGNNAEPTTVLLQISRDPEKKTQNICVYYAHNTIENDYYRKVTAFQTISMLGRLGDWVQKEAEKNNPLYQTEYYTKALDAKTFDRCKGKPLLISKLSNLKKEKWEKTSTLDDAKTFFDTGISLWGMGAVAGVALLFIFPPVQPFVVGIFALAGLVALGFALGNYIMHKIEQKKAAVPTVEIIEETSEENSTDDEERDLDLVDKPEVAPLMQRRHSDVSLGRSQNILLPQPSGTNKTSLDTNKPDQGSGNSPRK